jgi:hypothetical protein
MNVLITDPVELRRKGFTALVASLGWVNAVRFIQHYEAGQGDYTRERHQFLPDWDAAKLVREAREVASRSAASGEPTRLGEAGG